MAKQWAWVPASGASSTSLDTAAKARLEARVRELIDKELKPKHVKPPPKDARSNYLTDITLKWHGSTQWVELYLGKTLDECLAAIRDDPWFTP
jgi:hypothetical protein